MCVCVRVSLTGDYLRIRIRITQGDPMEMWEFFDLGRLGCGLRVGSSQTNPLARSIYRSHTYSQLLAIVCLCCELGGGS